MERKNDNKNKKIYPTWYAAFFSRASSLESLDKDGKSYIKHKQNEIFKYWIHNGLILET